MCRHWLLDCAQTAGGRRARDRDGPQTRQGTAVRFCRLHRMCGTQPRTLTEGSRSSASRGDYGRLSSVDRAVERFKDDIPGAHAEFMKLDLSDFGYALAGIFMLRVAQLACYCGEHWGRCTLRSKQRRVRLCRQVRSFATQINSSGMPLHILINNAGLGASRGARHMLLPWLWPHRPSGKSGAQCRFMQVSQPSRRFCGTSWALR